MRNCVTAQLPQLFSMRRPGVKFMDSESVEEPTAEKSLPDVMFTMVEPLFLLVSFRLAVTTISSMRSESSVSTKLTSMVLPLVVVTFFSTVP